MKIYYLLVALALPVLSIAQPDDKDNKKEVEQIIITKKGTADEKMNIVVDGDKVIVNGEPINNNDDDKITVKRRKIKDVLVFNDDMLSNYSRNYAIGQLPNLPNANKAMLGVTTKADDEGVVIVNVADESAADKVGLKEGDIITEINQEKIESPDELSKALKDKKPGDKVTVTYLRNSKKATAVATLTQWKAPKAMVLAGKAADPNIEIEEFFKDIPKEWNNDQNFYRYNYPGIVSANSGPKLGITIKDNEDGAGVKIIDVRTNSDAAKAGLKEGDIIKDVNGKKANEVDDVTAEVRKSRPGGSVQFKIERNGRTENIQVTFSKRIKSAEL